MEDIISEQNHKVIESLQDQPLTVCPHCRKTVDPVFSLEERVKVLIAMPVMGHIEPRAFDHFMDWRAWLTRLEHKSPVKFFFASVGDVLTPWARERLAEIAIAENFDYILFVDSDMLFPYDIFEKLYKHNVDIVVPLMFMRLGSHKPVIYRIKHGFDKQIHQEYFQTVIVEDYPKDTLFKVDGTGMGIMLIKIKVLKEITRPWFMNTAGTGEDVFFTEKATKAGFGVYVDTSIHDVAHLGERKQITEAVYLEQKNKALT